MTNVYMHLDLFCAIEYFCSLLRKDEGIRSWEITGGMSWNMACNRWWHDTNHDAGSDIKKSTHRLRLVYLLLCLLLMLLLWICMHNARDPLTRNPLPDSTYHLADLKSVTTESQNVSPSWQRFVLHLAYKYKGFEQWHLFVVLPRFRNGDS